MKARQLPKHPLPQHDILVVFGHDCPHAILRSRKFNIIVADKIFQNYIESAGSIFVDLAALVDPGSIQDASALAEELSVLRLANGSKLAKLFTHHGYDLWWLYYNALIQFFCLPYTQHQRLLTYLRTFPRVYFYQPPYKSLFHYYLQSYNSRVCTVGEPTVGVTKFIHFGIAIQILLTLLSLPILIVRRRPFLVFIGDKFEKSRDYDFRMGFIYKELRDRKLPFVEFIRSLESWRAVLQHAFIRRRPVIYAESVTFIGRICSLLFGGRRRVGREIATKVLAAEIDSERRFRLLVASHYLLGSSGDIWAIRIMKFILKIIGIQSAFITAASERNFHTVLGCKLLGIPTVGIMHGVATQHSTAYDFMPTFDGEKMLSVDRYGLWSKWWLDYYKQNSRAYRPEQLFVSGPMRPLLDDISCSSEEEKQMTSSRIRVLFISEQVAEPKEIMPYLNALIEQDDFICTIKFRSYRDGFEEWIGENAFSLLQQKAVDKVYGPMQEAIKNNDVVVGSYSTAALEALLQLKAPIFMNTRKWGDYYGMSQSVDRHCFFATNPRELIERIRAAKNIPLQRLMELREQYFGDPHQNGSAWVIDRLEESVDNKKSN